jgi:hypothetical protein
MAAVGVGEQEEGTGIILKRQVRAGRTWATAWGRYAFASACAWPTLPADDDRAGRGPATRLLLLLLLVVVVVVVQVMLMLMLLLLLLLLRRRLRLLLLLQLLLLSFSERAPGTRSAAPHSLQRPRPSPRPAPGAAAATSPSCAIPCSGCARWAAFLATSSRLGDAAAAGGGGACSGSSTGSAGSAVRTGGPLGLQDRRPDFFTAPRMLVERERRVGTARQPSCAAHAGSPRDSHMLVAPSRLAPASAPAAAPDCRPNPPFHVCPAPGRGPAGAQRRVPEGRC